MRPMMAMMPSAALLIAVAALVSSASSGVVVSSAVAAAPLPDAVGGSDRRRDDGSNKHVIVVVGGGGGTARRPSDPPPTRTRTSAATNGVVDLRRFSVGKKLPAAGPVPAVADHDRRVDDASHRGQSAVAGVGGSHSDPAAASEQVLTEQPPFPASLSAGLSVIRPVNPAINSADCPEMTARHPPAAATAACEELLFFRWFELWGGPCPVGQWLVLDPDTLAPRCRRPECPLAAGQLPFHDRHPGLPEKDSPSSSPMRCVLASSPPADVCPPGQWLVADEFGRGRCECRDGHLHWPGNGACYPAFTRGPCPDERSLLVWDDVGNEVTCRWNPCPDGQIYWLSRGDCYPWPAPTADDATRRDDEVAAATRPQSNESSSPPSTTDPCPPGRRLAVERPDCLSSDAPSCIGKPSYPPVRLICADENDDDERAAVFVASVDADRRPSHPAAGSTATEDDGKEDGINASPTMLRLIFPRRRRRAVVSDDDNGDDFDARYVSSKSTLWRADDRLALLADGGDDEERGRDGDGRHGEEEERRYSVAADDNRAGGGDDDDDGGEEQERYVMPGRVPFRKWVCGPGTVKDFLGHCRRRVPEPAAADPTADSGRPTLVSTLASPTFAKKRQAANR